jgi:A/G-specific adenine glycosylase
MFLKDMTGGGRDPETLPAGEESLRGAFRKNGLTPGVVAAFRRFLMGYYGTHGRDLPWRRTTDPYRILVSEFMLQQTQVERVLSKYPEFLGRFPHVGVLARAPRRDVLLAWQGLGYNRRAIALHDTAKRVDREFRGTIPLDRATLDSFPGIGNATAGAVVVFSTNRPEIFIETNIRRVYIHLFFPDVSHVRDRDIEPILGKTLLRRRPRDFYYALMDYGSFLKRGPGNPNIRSASYSRQSRFEGSDRQVRGFILRRLLAAGEIPDKVLRSSVPVGRRRLERILLGLSKDGFIERSGGAIRYREGSGRE